VVPSSFKQASKRVAAARPRGVAATSDMLAALLPEVSKKRGFNSASTAFLLVFVVGGRLQKTAKAQWNVRQRCDEVKLLHTMWQPKY